MKPSLAPLLPILAVIIIIASGVTKRPHPKPVPTPTPLPIAHCHLRAAADGSLVLQDLACTPGVTNPDVTQANIETTICQPGWTATQRPPVAYTNALKKTQMAEYGFTDAIQSHEEDHLIPLELGGAPSDPGNLWPEPGASPNPKDAKENHLREQVCSGALTLEEAQREIVADWTTADP